MPMAKTRRSQQRTGRATKGAWLDLPACACKRQMWGGKPRVHSALKCMSPGQSKQDTSSLWHRHHSRFRPCCGTRSACMGANPCAALAQAVDGWRAVSTEGVDVAEVRGNARADTDLVGDDELVAVEEALEQDEDDGIKLEPFNLAQERAEGVFDEDGHYVERREEDEEEKDAWFASAKGARRLQSPACPPVRLACMRLSQEPRGPSWVAMQSR